MHQARTAIMNGKVPAAHSPVATKERCRRSAEATLAAINIAREERRRTDQRREDRFQGAVERVTITFRRKTSLVPVLNISASGVMIESSILPRIGEKIGLEFEGFARLDGFVRWVRQGRIGLDLGEGAITVG